MADIRPINSTHHTAALADGGGGGNNGGMEARVAKLEAASEHLVREMSELRGDVRELRGSLRVHMYWTIGSFAAMLLVMAKGFGWL